MKEVIKKIGAIFMTATIFISFSAFGRKEETTEVTTPAEVVESATFLYPSKTSDFRYDRYDSYIAISQCLSLKQNIVIPDQIDGLPVYVIEQNCFADQTTIVNVNITSNVFDIGESAFENCPNLESVSLPDNLSSIGQDCFKDCVSLKSLELPASLEYIPSGLCEGCDSLSFVIIDDHEVTGQDENGNDLYSADRTIDTAFNNCESLRFTYIPEGVLFGEDSDTDVFSGSTDNLTIYSYSSTDAAKYASENYCDFVLCKSKADLVTFRSVAATASKTTTISSGSTFKGENVEITIDSIYVFKTGVGYNVSYEVDNEIVTKDYTFEPPTGACVIVFGLEVKNLKQSTPISIDPLTSTVSVDSYSHRLCDLGSLAGSIVSKFAASAYTTDIENTQYVYVACIAEEDWTQADLSFAIEDISELNSVSFTVKSIDKNITYIGSSDSVIEESTTAAEETTSEATSETASVAESTTAVTESTTAVTTAAGESTTVKS